MNGTSFGAHAVEAFEVELNPKLAAMYPRDAIVTTDVATPLGKPEE